MHRLKGQEGVQRTLCSGSNCMGGREELAHGLCVSVQGQPIAEMVAQGGPTVTGQNAAALHPRKIGNGSTPALKTGA